MSSPLSDSMDQLLDRFDDAWNGPSPPRIEDYLLLPPDAPAYLPMLTELVKIDLERRLRRGELPQLDDYRQRFPACAEAVADWLAEARAAAERAAALDKETHDPQILPTLDGPPTPTSTLPSRLVGEYEVLGSLGSGGMGEVYKARHRRLDKFVALKLLPADSQSSRELTARFQREMKAVGALDHPNVVEAYDAGEQSGVIYLAMKLIDGVDLERLVKERGPLPIAEACELVRQAAFGLHYLHERGLIHRDVKPSNLMRTPDGTVKVLDLGLARWCIDAEAGHGLTGKGRVMGTPDFLAPEQLDNAASADPRADLYGLGGTLFYLLTGRPPFAPHKLLFSKLEAHRSAPPPDLRTLRSEVPPELSALIQRLLAKKPEQRLANAAEVAAALAPFIGLPQRPHGPAQRSIAPRRPSLFALTGGVAIVGLLILLAGIGMHMLRSEKPLENTTAKEQSSVSPQSETVSPDKSKAQPVRLTLEILHQPAADRFLKPALLGEEDAYATRFGDSATVTARLSQPAYVFLIALRPDGKVEGIYPKDDTQPPEPKGGMSARYDLNDAVGFEAFAAVASSQPLPSFKEWRMRYGELPWGKFEPPRDMAFRANGIDDVEDLYDRNRSKPRPAGREAIQELAEWLRKKPGIEAVQVLGFAVEPKEKR